jgi:hypothetical protein
MQNNNDPSLQNPCGNPWAEQRGIDLIEVINLPVMFEKERLTGLEILV